MSKARRKAKTVRPQGELTIYRVGEHAEAFKVALAGHSGELSVDLSAVSEIDSAGLQLLLHWRRAAEAVGCRLVLAGASSVVRELAQFCHLGALLQAAEAPLESGKAA